MLLNARLSEEAESPDEFKQAVLRLGALLPHEYDRCRQEEADRLGCPHEDAG